MYKEASSNGIGWQQIADTLIKHENVRKGATPGFKAEKPWPYDTMHGVKVYFPNSDNRTGLAYFHPSIPKEKYKELSRKMIRSQFNNYVKGSSSFKADPDISIWDAIQKFDPSPTNKTKLEMLKQNNPWLTKQYENFKNIPVKYFLKGNKFNRPQ